MKAELIEYLKEPMMYLGLAGAYFDGLVIAQCWDWITTTHRMSIWLLM